MSLRALECLGLGVQRWLRGRYVDTWGRGGEDLSPGVAGPEEGVEGLLPAAPPPLHPPPPSGCSSPALLHAGLRKMDFPGCANLAATCSRCAGASKVAQLQTQSSWESRCQAPSSPPLLQRQQLGLQVILSPAVIWAGPSFPHHDPARPLQPSPGLSPS